jgi:hypothetical protein
MSSVKVTTAPSRFGLTEWPAVSITPGLLDIHTNFSRSENSVMRQTAGSNFGWMIRTRLSRPIGPSSKGSIREIDLVQSGQRLTSMRTAQIWSTGAAITNAVSKCVTSLSRFRGNSFGVDAVCISAASSESPSKGASELARPVALEPFAMSQQHAFGIPVEHRLDRHAKLTSVGQE